MAERVPRRRRTKAEIEQARRKALARRKHHLKTKHRMTLEEYELIKVFQGGYCPICLRSNGKTKALAVDHDHVVAREQCEHPENESCIECWRGLCCGPCNDMLAWSRDDPEVFARAMTYLVNPPAQALRRSIDRTVGDHVPRVPWSMGTQTQLMPCIVCGKRVCELGVPTCSECDAPPLRVDKQKMNEAYFASRETIQYRPGE